MKKALIFLALWLAAFPALAVQIVTESPNPACEQLHLARELKIYKDPALFLSNISGDSDEALLNENPVLTTLKGTVQLMRLGPPREFRGFGALAKVYEMVEPKLRAGSGRSGREREQDRSQKADRSSSAGSTRAGGLSPLIVPIKICGNDAYSDTLGFVLLSDLRESQIEEYEPGMLPPSVFPNPIPSLKSPRTASGRAEGTKNKD